MSILATMDAFCFGRRGGAVFAPLFFCFCFSMAAPPQQDGGGQKQNFEIAHQWSYVNFTWPSRGLYKYAVATGQYIPENNFVAGIRFYKGDIYFTLPRLRPGTPVTLAYMPSGSPKMNPLVTPYPSWSMNVKKDCSTLQNVISMEIDTKGVMWVLDGVRLNNLTKCPPKLVMLDLNKNGAVIHTYEFPEEISAAIGGLLDDIVIDESDGGYAYMTETSFKDPGLVVYSKLQDKAWKFRDKTMFADIEASIFEVDGAPVTPLVAIDGIALAPKKLFGERLLYYCSLSSLKLYAISTEVLKSGLLYMSGEWRRLVKYVGAKSSQSDGITMDNKGNMYYGLLSTYGIGRWNTKKSFDTAETVYEDRENVIWPDTFAFDSDGYMYVTCDTFIKYFIPIYPIGLTDDIKIRVLKTYTGTNSYLH